MSEIDKTLLFYRGPLKAYQPNSDGSTRRYHLQVFHSIGRGAAFAAICCIVLANHSQTLQVTANWGSPTGITTTDTSYGINADRTDPRIVGYPGNAAYNSQLSRLGVQYLRIWGGGDSGRIQTGQAAGAFMRSLRTRDGTSKTSRIPSETMRHTAPSTSCWRSAAGLRG
jgi:hypothetical protein